VAFKQSKQKKRNSLKQTKNRPHKTYPWILNNQKRPSPQYAPHATYTTVKHILTEFLKYEDLRKENGLPYQLSEILELGEEANIKVIHLLKMSELYDLI